MKKLFAVIVTATVAAIGGHATAQVYPSRPITMIVPYPPGGPTDVLARIVSERMRTSLGQPIVVENVSGAGGTIGVRRTLRAAPDGHTIGIGQVASHVFGSVVYRLQSDVLDNLEPVGLLTIAPMWILATNALPAKDLKELIAWLKANPDKASAGIVGTGSPAHLCGVYFQNNTGTRFQFVPYRGAAPAMQDLIAGQIDLACLEASNTRQHVQSGKIKAYAVTTEARLPSFGQLYDVLATWQEKAVDVRGRALDCGHALQEEAPEEVLQELLAFLSANEEGIE